MALMVPPFAPMPAEIFSNFFYSSVTIMARNGGEGKGRAAGLVNGA
jgi:hypothetical protein